MKGREGMVSLQGLQKLTLLDYPGKVACTVFTGGCNFRCPFCQNRDLLPCGQPSQYSEAELLGFLQKRRGLLDGVGISGGEPLLQEELPQLLEKIKAMGYCVKLDTNGSFPEQLQQLVAENLVDYVAMDIKSSPSQYGAASGVGRLYLSKVQQSVQFLLRGTVPYEFRTTVVRELHGAEELQAIGQWLQGAQRYFLQGFEDSERVLKPGLHSYSAAEMERLRQLVLPWVPQTALRGITADRISMEKM